MFYFWKKYFYKTYMKRQIIKFLIKEYFQLLYERKK